MLIIFFSKKCLERVRLTIAYNWFEPPMQVIDRNKAITQHFWRYHLIKKGKKEKRSKTSLF